jgi:hypothetical protein
VDKLVNSITQNYKKFTKRRTTQLLSETLDFPRFL